MTYEQKLQVAPPRGRDMQLPTESDATFEQSIATGNATADLKALADRYLKRRSGDGECNPDATEPEKTMQLPGDSGGAKVALDEELGAYSEEVPNWLEWIAERCPLLPDDKPYVLKGLLWLHPKLQQRMAERYVEVWHAAAEAEPQPHKKDNAGRRAANYLLQIQQ